MMKTLEMMIEAEKTGKTYITGSMRYSITKGFHDDKGEPWTANAFDTINDIMCLDNWRLLDVNRTLPTKMTLRQIEELLGHRIELVSS